MTSHATSLWQAGAPCSDALDVHLLGCVDFDSALFLQERLAYDISGRRDRHGTLLICEHPPLVTFGRDGSRGELMLTEEERTVRELECRWVSRGGGTVLHAPGQLSVYPIVPLHRIGISPWNYGWALRDAVCRVGSELKIGCRASATAAEVTGRCGAYAQIGATIRSQITRHGVFLDVSTSPRILELLAPQEGAARRSSVSIERVGPVEMHTVRESIIRHLAARLGYQNINLFTGHPLLVRTSRRIHDYAKHSG